MLTGATNCNISTIKAKLPIRKTSINLNGNFVSQFFCLALCRSSSVRGIFNYWWLVCHWASVKLIFGITNTNGRKLDTDWSIHLEELVCGEIDRIFEMWRHFNIIWSTLFQVLIISLSLFLKLSFWNALLFSHFWATTSFAVKVYSSNLDGMKLICNNVVSTSSAVCMQI